jgi:peptidyl-prolyl cis-trans isomerase SurA
MSYFFFHSRILLFLLLIGQVASAEVIEKIYAVVNGEIITLTEIADYRERLKSGGFLNDLLFSEPEVRDKALEDKDYLLKLMIQEKIMDYEIKQQGLQITEERVKKEIGTIAKRQNMSMAQMEMAIESQGIDFLEYKDFVKSSIERRQLVEKEITSKIKISEQDIVSRYLATNGSKGSQIFEFSLSHILLKTQDKPVAEKVISSLENGQSFESLVSQFSTDTDSKDNSGFFGKFKTGEMISAIERAIQDLQVGQTTGIVETPMGLHVFKIMDKKLVNDPRMEKEKQNIYQQLFAQEFKEQLSFWLSQKQKDAIIQINNT